MGIDIGDDVDEMRAQAEGATRRRPRLTPRAARFRELIERAMFELRMAGDVAKAEGFAPAVLPLLEGSSTALRRCLAKTQTAKPHGARESFRVGTEGRLEYLLWPAAARAIVARQFNRT